MASDQQSILLSGLPPLNDINDFKLALSTEAPDPSLVRTKDVSVREYEYLPNIENWFFVGPQQFQVAKKIHGMMHEGYIRRHQPGSRLHNDNLYSTGDIKPIAPGKKSIVALITGITGLGKTKVVEQALSLYPQVYKHHNYPGFKGVKPQILWLSMSIVSSSLKDFARDLACAWNDIFATHFPNMPLPISERDIQKDSGNELIRQFLRSAVAYDLGLIYIDEIQSLFKGNQNKFLNKHNAKPPAKDGDTLTHLLGIINKCIPVVLSCTPDGAAGLSKRTSTCRRTGTNTIKLLPISTGKHLNSFMESLWKYQYLDLPLELTDEIIQLFYDKTFGVPALIVESFINAQRSAFTAGSSKLDICHFQATFQDFSADLKLLNMAYHNKDYDFLKTRPDADIYNESP